MRRAGWPAVLALVAGCGGDEAPVAPQPDAGVPFTECDGSDQAFVRHATLAVLGRRPRGQAEVLVHADVMANVRALAAASPASSIDPREVVVRALLDDPGAVDRWSEHFMDALEVPRIEAQSQRSCYGIAAREPAEGIDDGSLARAARDGSPRDGGDGLGRFTMLDLLRSALRLDDVSIVYRANLYAMVSRPIAAANVPPVEAELARREDFGLLFDAAYLNRDLVCLGCHNSDFSVTFRPEPADNRHWPLAAGLEAAIYGAPTGVEAERAHAPFRFSGFVTDPQAGDAIRPWGWDASCGSFAPDGIDPDPAGVDGRLASLTGDRLTVFDLDAALRRGFERLAAGGLVRDEEGAIADPDAAMAYLVASTIVEGVWREVIGTPLTIANDFPRTQAARDVLAELTDGFVAGGYSLRELLVDILTSDYFNRLPPEAGCGGPYDMPAIYDPWVASDPDPARRRNGPGDAVAPLSPRVLLRATHEALEWPRPFFYAFPEEPPEIEVCSATYTCEEMADVCDRDGQCCEAYKLECADPPVDATPAAQLRGFERGIGIFLKHADRGFRGLDFQARLVLEDAFGACVSPGLAPDFVSGVIDRARSDAGATVGDVVAAIKDRLIGDARTDGGGGSSGPGEQKAIEALFGAGVDAPAAGVDELEARARTLCGVLLSSPQFLLGGMVAPDTSSIPRLTPDGAGYAAICSFLSCTGLTDGLVLTCGDSALSVSEAH